MMGLRAILCGIAGTLLVGTVNEDAWAERYARPSRTDVTAARADLARMHAEARIARERERQLRLEAARRARFRPQPVQQFVPGGYPYGYPYRGYGYAPQITWLPTGARLNVAGTVSPDGRHVRVTAQPFFSNVPAVHTFNWATGEYRRIR